MKAFFNIILVAVTFGSATAQLKAGNLLFFHAGGNSFKENGMGGDYEVAAKRFTFQGKLYLMSKKTPYVGFKFTGGFYTLGIDEDYYAKKFGNPAHNSFDSDLRINPILTVGPVVFIRSKLIDICIEPALGIVGALSPNVTHIYEDANVLSKESWEYSSAKPALGATLGIGLYRKIADNIILTVSGEYAFAKSMKTTKYSEYRLESDDDSPTTHSATSNVPKSVAKEGLIFSVGLGFYLPAVKSTAN